MSLLDPSSSPTGPIGGVPFCFSGSLGSIMCYSPAYLQNAYDFPANQGHGGSDGTGSTVVIVDAFGSPTIQSDLNTFDSTFGLPAATVTILCGPTWTGAASDNCPVKTVGDLSTAPNAGVCGATGWAEETTLDVTMVHGLAPGARIVLVVANDCFDTSINNAEQAVVSQASLKGSIMSQSFGEPDDQVSPSIQSVADSIYATAAANQWTVLASSGDLGANENAGSGSLELTPSWPSTSPLVLAVGGTEGSPYGGQYGPPPGPGGVVSCAPHSKCNTGLEIVKSGSNGCATAVRPGVPTDCAPFSYGGESAWNEALTIGLGTATGGGISSIYPVPSYQSSLPTSWTTFLGNTVPSTGRLVPDVSFNSAVDGGVLAYLGFLGRWAVFGGTSASSPAWAAIIAILNQKNGGPVGFINPAIYALAEGPHYKHAFHDITAGNNAVCEGLCGEDGFNAGPGYDLTTGWGTPDVASFISMFLASNH